MQRRYPASSSTSSRAATEDRPPGSRLCVLVTVVLVTDAASHPAAEAKLRLPGRVRRRDPPGVRWRPGDRHAPPTGYLQEETQDTRGPDDAACGAPCCAPQHLPPPGSPRSRSWLARHCPAERAGGQRPAAAPRGCRRAPHGRSRGACASARLREASAVTVAPAAPGARGTRAGQTLTLARPLRRRAARIARPARDRMRSRNPCVFARCRLFGWNVRLLTETPGTQGGLRRPAPPAAAQRGSPRTCESQPCGGRTNERYAGRVPLVKPGPRHPAPAHLPIPRPPPHPPSLVSRLRRGRHPAQHFPFARRAPKPAPRLWTTVLARGSGIGWSPNPGLPATDGEAAAPRCTCTTCG
jgi:hypothetical protein